MQQPYFFDFDKQPLVKIEQNDHGKKLIIEINFTDIVQEDGTPPSDAYSHLAHILSQICNANLVEQIEKALDER